MATNNKAQGMKDMLKKLINWVQTKLYGQMVNCRCKTYHRTKIERCPDCHQLFRTLEGKNIIDRPQVEFYSDELPEVF